MKMETLIRSIAGDFTDEVIEELLLRSRGKVNKALQRIRRPQAAVGVVKSKLGNLLVAMTARGIALNHYLEDTRNVAAAVAKLRLEFDPVEDQRVVGEVGQEVNRYLTGEVNVLRQNIDLTLAGNAFQKKVLDRLQTVPRGAVISYQALGAAVGSASSARAVGNALHNNPVPIYVPCHRVISSDGRIGGYAGGAARKLQLLRSEGFAVDDDTTSLPGTTVWGHRGTKIYCRLGCRTRARVDRARTLFFADPEQAQRAGMRPCKICRPG
ncbi:MAG: methylated-DNA--[protein]-cysteine S-methyltransferase [Candidatus Binatia bacterium]